MFDNLSGFKNRFYSLIAREISAWSKYYDSLFQYQPRFHDEGILFERVECQNKKLLNADELLPDLNKKSQKRNVVLLNGNFNHSFDIEALLKDVYKSISRNDRVVVVTYNPYLGWLFQLATWFGVRKGPVPSTFITVTDLMNLAGLSHFDVLKINPCGLFPFKLFGLGVKIEGLLKQIPLIRSLAICNILVLRPIKKSEEFLPTLSILIPARNEKGNIEDALKRLPDLNTNLQVIFIEGNSNDGTWEEIQRVIPLYQRPGLEILSFKQPGRGKNDAVKVGFEKSTMDLVTILDADLTMPPELLGRFYDAYKSGMADFINGSRLVYPMEGEAMRPLNRLGNIFFAKALSTVLNTRLGDSLCGTKLFALHDYKRFQSWRNDFGNFDPFGDFELLFPAAILQLGIVDIPVRYRSRTYGTTNISRFRDGWQLFRMTLVGLLHVRLDLKASSQAQA